ncbi:hypothetical protein [Legionella maioricensis]|uniref:Uncharacterized protein n=1 Tax=Legionella maioricensis TaxID=2896528 RepID=A0A9X2D222_9GAMM|nr:hypothetical protein [Legionella maioricensis]MCL9685210.1 hypothetical protein [Legionella maioricensis]MCL9688427.1 hypothetical protein [Legionella maioricensis]
MQKKKILVITPVQHCPSFIEPIIKPLSFLDEEYSIHPIDSLAQMDDIPSQEYYHYWQQELAKYIPHYDAFFGFSFGGIILQQCFSLFTNSNKPIVLFSTPTFADHSLTKKLGEVIALCQESKIDEALSALYQHVYYPNKIPPQETQPFDPVIAAKRMIFGLTRVLETDSTSVLKENEVNHLHLIGELSHLVNKDNVTAAPKGRLLSVPEAGMRMLRDNLPFCKKAILETLNSEA